MSETSELAIREARTGDASLVCHFYFKLFEQQFDFTQGFRLTETKPNTVWARYPMTEEKWEWDATDSCGEESR